MDIPAVPVDIIARGRDGHKILIEADVCNVAADLKRIDPYLRVRWSELGEYFVVYREVEKSDGSVDQDLVLTSYELDQRVVKRVEKISHSSYNYGKELEKAEDQAKRDQEHIFDEQVGDIGQKLAHAIRKDLGDKSDAQRAADIRWKHGKN
jgi:hypothetical protein